LKILFLKEKRSESGIEGTASYLFNVCKELNKLNIEYLVLYNDEDQFFKKMIDNSINVQLYKFPPNSPKNLFKTSKIRKAQNDIYNIVQREQITHINVHFPYLLQFVKNEWRLPIIAHWHGAFEKNKPLKHVYFKDLLNLRAILNSIYRKNKLFNFDKADLVICAGEAAKNTAVEKFLVDEHKISLNMYGAPEKKIDKVKNIREELKIDDAQKVIISVGRETKAKGVEDFCKVAKKLSDKNYKFLYLGGYRDENYHNYLVKKYGKYVEFLGMKINVDEYYKVADLMLFLSHRESAPTVLFEAMAFSLPMISWNTVGVNELIVNNYNGYSCPLKDIEYVVEKVSLVLDDRGVYHKLSKNSCKDFKNKYNFSLHVKKLINSFIKISWNEND
jgi:glycosyltransferase involved in cell wall biosynthesis